MEWYVTLVLMFGLLFLLIMLGLPIAFALGFLSVAGLWLLVGPNSLNILGNIVFHHSTNFLYIAMPLFILMAEVLGFTGAAADLFKFAENMLGRLPGGLAMAAVVCCAVFAAACGTSTGCAATIGIVAIPELLKRGYSKSLTGGTVAAGGTLGILIPPSGIMILYSILTEVSVGKMFIAGVFPGIMIALMMCIYIYFHFRFGRKRETVVAPSPLPWKTRLASVRGVWSFVLIIVAVLGSIYTGISTPTESAALGAVASLIVGLVYGRLNWKTFSHSLINTVRVSTFIFFIIFGAVAFGFLLSNLGVIKGLSDWVTSLPLPPITFVIIYQILILLLGCFIDPAGMMVISMPIAFPIALKLGFDPIWFGILFTINSEVGNITPPMGLNLFVIKSISPPEVTLQDIIRGVVPYIFILIAGIAIIMLFPQITLWLPGKMMGG